MAVEHGVYKFVSENHILDAVATNTIDAATFIVLVARFIKHEVEKVSLGRAKMEETFSKLDEVVDEQKIKAEDGIASTRMDLTQSSSPLTDMSDDKIVNSRVYSRLTVSDESDGRRYESIRRAGRSRCHRSRRHHCSTTLPAYKREHYKSSVKVLEPVNERYQNAVDYCSYRLIHSCQ